MPKHTGMSQEKKKTRTQKNGAAIRASVEANSRNGALPRRHRRPPAAASAAPPLGTPGCWPHQTPRFSLPLVPIGAQLLSGGGGFRGPWRAGTRGPAALFRSLPRLCRRLASPRRCARLIPRDWQAAQRAGAGAGCRPATRPPSEQRSSVARSHSFFTPDLSLWTLSRSLPGLFSAPEGPHRLSGRAGRFCERRPSSLPERGTHTNTHTHTHIQAHAGRHTHTRRHTQLARASSLRFAAIPLCLLCVVSVPPAAATTTTITIAAAYSAMPNLANLPCHACPCHTIPYPPILCLVSACVCST